MLITVIGGTIVGLTLGLTGGGGSIFAVPLLIYAIGLPPSQAMPVSLAAVGFVAAVGAVQVLRVKLITAWQPVFVFAVGSMIGAPLGLRLAHGIDARMLVTGFALLALTVGVSLWLRAKSHPEYSKVVRALPEGDSQGPVCALAEDGMLRLTTPCSLVLVLAGLTTGLLSGVFGVGGGFLIVPALMMITRMGIHSAVATSIVVIAVTGLTGAGYAVLQGSIVWTVLLPFAIGGTLGMVFGRLLASRIVAPRLQQIFSGAIVMVAVGMLIGGIIS